LAGSHVVAARLEFVNDVADLEAAGQGRWSPVGLLRCERVVAADSKHADQPGYHVELPLPAGRYVGEVFTTDSDLLGIRVRLV
jgi:hypothetical protein